MPTRRNRRIRQKNYGLRLFTASATDLPRVILSVPLARRDLSDVAHLGIGGPEMDAEAETLKKGRQSFRGAIMSQLRKSPRHFSNEFSMQEVKLLFPIVPVAAKPPLGIPAPIDNDRKCYANVSFRQQ